MAIKTPLYRMRSQGQRIGKKELVAPVTSLQKLPPAPKYFNKELRELWKEACTNLLAMNALTQESFPTIETFCTSMLAMRNIVVDENASNSRKVAAIEAARRCATELGFSPSAHRRVRPLSAPSTSSLADMLN